MIEKGFMIFFAAVTLVGMFFTVLFHVIPSGDNPTQHPFNLGLVFWAVIAGFWALVYVFHKIDE